MISAMRNIVNFIKILLIKNKLISYVCVKYVIGKLCIIIITELLKIYREILRLQRENNIVSHRVFNIARNGEGVT